MSEQLFRKVEGSNGVLKLLFSCHKDDFDKHFSELSSEILDVQDCSMYYLEDQSHTPEDIENYKVQLSEFNLFVFPITSNFLNEDNRAKDIDFKFAYEHRYPLLPILVEPNLYDKFNETVENVQILDRTTNDPTQESYKVKLEKYLKTVLVDNETIKKIKDAFDAYIFLSYRKKDRKYAQEIMSLIHKNDFMRDIAIWYDEFLTPGENFNDEISNNLLKSKLVTLVVTPNINERYGEKGNYVIEEEYPRAIKENKPVLPIEAVETNKEELKNNFKDIQNPINKENYDKITEFFKDFIIKNGLDENDDDPGHLYFIGLAYLNGIDTDRNPEKAIEILEKSEDLFYKQFPEQRNLSYDPIPWSSKMLVNIYENGIGTTINLKKAILHQKKIKDFLWKNSNHDDSLYTAYFRYEFSRMKLCELYIKDGNYDYARGELSYSIGFEQGNDFNFMPTLYVKYMWAYVNDKVGNHECAKKIYTDINNTIAKQSEIGFTYLEINNLYEKMSTLYDFANDSDSSLYYDELVSEIKSSSLSLKKSLKNLDIWLYAKDLFGLTRDELNYLYFSDTMKSAIQCGIGLNCCYVGDIEHGINLIKDCLDKYGHDNYDNDFALAEAYYLASNYNESLEILDKVSKYYAKKYETSHPKILECDFVVAKCYKGLEKYKEANNILDNLIKKQESIYGKNNVFTQNSIDLYNENMALMGNHEALEMLEKSCDETFGNQYSKHREYFDEFDKVVFDKYNKFIELLLKTNNYEKAMNLIEKLYFRRNKVYNKKGIEVIYFNYLFTNPNKSFYEKVLNYLNMIKDNCDSFDKHKMSNFIAMSLLNMDNPKEAQDLLLKNECLENKEATEYLTSLQIQCRCCDELNEIDDALQNIGNIISILSKELVKNHVDFLCAQIEYFKLLIKANRFDYTEYEQVYSLGTKMNKFVKEYDGELEQNKIDNSIFDGYVTHNYYGEFYFYIHDIISRITIIVLQFYKNKKDEADIVDKKFLKLEREIGYIHNFSKRIEPLYRKYLDISFEKLYEQRVKNLGESNIATINLKIINAYWETRGYTYISKDIINLCEIYKAASSIDDNDDMSLFALNVYFATDGIDFVHERNNEVGRFFNQEEMMSKEEIIENLKAYIEEAKKIYNKTKYKDFLDDIEKVNNILKNAFEINDSN
jgi:hypothetical protein